jgi:hypothetical protein
MNIYDKACLDDLKPYLIKFYNFDMFGKDIKYFIVLNN